MSTCTEQEVSAKRVYVHHNYAQRRLLDRLIRHGCITTDLRTWEEVKTVWLLVPVKNCGGLRVGLSIKEVMGYVKNVRKYWKNGKEAREIARRAWARWVESHREKVCPVVNNAEPLRVRLGEEIVEENVANGAAAPSKDAKVLIEPAPEAPRHAAPQPRPAASLAAEHVFKYRKIRPQEFDPSLVDIHYGDDEGHIIHPLGWREGFGIYGPDRPLPCLTTPHSYPMRVMPTDRYTMPTVSSNEPQLEPPLYPHNLQSGLSQT